MTKRVIIFRTLMFIYIAAMAYLMFAKIGGASIPKEIWGIAGDKFLHFWLFFPFPALAVLTLKDLPKGFLSITWTVTVMFLAGCGIAGLTELVQDIIPYREANWGDLRSDVYSMAICAMVTYLTFLSVPSKKKHKK